MCTKYHLTMPVTWYENHHNLTTKGSYISTKQTHKTSTLYLSEDICPHSTYMWCRSQTSNWINFIWFYPFLIRFSYSFLYYTIQDTLPLMDVTRLRSRCALVCSAKTGEWYYIYSITHTLLLCHYFVTFMYNIDYSQIHMDFVILQNKWYNVWYE